MRNWYIVFLIVAFQFCAAEKKKPVKEKDNPVKWIDDNTLHIRTFGLVPSPKKDATTNRLMACQEARARSIEIFNSQFTKPKQEMDEYSGRQYNNEFHKYTMKISTFSKNNDEKGNCHMIMQFQGENLKARLNAR